MSRWQHIDQVESTLWTIVEENVGIICACLPMFRPFLSIVMPRLFPKRGHNVSSGSAKLSSGSSRRGGWTPPVHTHSKNIQLTSVVKGNNSSEEMIVGGMPDSPAMSDGTITKVTHFSVKYGSWNGDISLLSLVQFDECILEVSRKRQLDLAGMGALICYLLFGT